MPKKRFSPTRERDRSRSLSRGRYHEPRINGDKPVRPPAYHQYDRSATPTAGGGRPAALFWPADPSDRLPPANVSTLEGTPADRIKRRPDGKPDKFKAPCASNGGLDDCQPETYWVERGDSNGLALKVKCSDKTSFKVDILFEILKHMPDDEYLAGLFLAANPATFYMWAVFPGSQPPDKNQINKSRAKYGDKCLYMPIQAFAPGSFSKVNRQTLRFGSEHQYFSMPAGQVRTFHT